MQQFLILTALAAAIPPEDGGRLRAAEALEVALRDAERAQREGRRGRPALELGLATAIRALGPASEIAAELERLAHGARFEAFLDGGESTPWLANQLPTLISDLRFEPVLEAALPADFPRWTPVGEIEIKHYPAYRMARTSTQTSGSDGAFWRLFGHIERNEIAMTAPVESTYMVREEGLARSTMAFLYGSRRLGRLGTDGAVEVVDHPAQVVVSTGMRGVESSRRIAAARERLERWLRSHPGWIAVGPLRSMAYNSPMVLGDRRYFEVQIPVKRAGQVVIDFGGADEAPRWRAVDDVVMGGRSSSRMAATIEGTCVFRGDLSLENNGGFASVRRDVEDAPLAGATSVVLRVRGDGKNYQFRCRTEGGFDVPSYQAEFETVPGEWIDVRLDLADFEPKWRGRPVLGAPPLDASAVRGFGFLIADKQAGPFRLELASLSKL